MPEVQRDNQVSNREDSVLFITLLQMFAHQAMMQLGKIKNPVTHKAQRDLEGASFTIGLLEILQKKTQGNLSKEEDQILKNLLTDLRLNYVEEAKLAEAEATAAKERGQPSPTAEPPRAETPSAKPSDTAKAAGENESKVKFHKKYDI